MNSDMIILENFIDNHPAEVARLLEQQDIGITCSFLNEINILLQVKLYNHLERFTAIKCLEMIDPDRSAKIIERLPFATGAIIIRQITKELRELILTNIDKTISSPLQQVLKYGPDTVGAFTDPLVPTLSLNFTAEESLQYIKKQSVTVIENIFIVNRDHTLAGIITLQKLLLMQLDEPIISHLQTDLITLLAEADYHSIIDHPGWLEYHTLPVVDASGIFLGAIAHKTIRQIGEDRFKRRLSKQAIETSNALGELFRLGLSGLISSALKTYPEYK